jgi:hypothetical protein
MKENKIKVTNFVSSYKPIYCATLSIYSKIIGLGNR